MEGLTLGVGTQPADAHGHAALGAVVGRRQNLAADEVRVHGYASAQ